MLIAPIDQLQAITRQRRALEDAIERAKSAMAAQDASGARAWMQMAASAAARISDLASEGAHEIRETEEVSS